MEDERPGPQPAFPSWYGPVSGVVCAGCVAVPMLSFPLNVVLAAGVSAGAGLYLGYHQRRTELPQGIGRGRQRLVAFALIALLVTLLALAVVVRRGDLPGSVAATLVFTGFVIGFVYPRAWQAAGKGTVD